MPNGSKRQPKQTQPDVVPVAKTVAKKKAALKKTAAMKTNGSGAVVDWSKIKQEYISDTTTSYATLAKKYGVTKRQVEEKGRKEGWVNQRQAFGEEVEERIKEDLIEQREQANKRHGEQYRTLQQAVVHTLTTLTGKKDRKGNPKPINPKYLADLARALKVSTEGERLSLGLPNSVTGLSDPDGNPTAFDILGDLSDAETADS